jgi:hypothetical protein
MKLIEKLKICLVLLLTLSFVSTTLASPGKYVQLEQGEKIPWQGWCFDGQAMAELVASKELAEQKCELYTMQELEQQQAKFDLQIGQLQASMQYEVQTRDVAIQSLQEENLKIEEALIHQTKYGWIAPSAFGFVVGALTIFLVTL